MQYGLLLWPHSNARYQVEARKLACAELLCIAKNTFGDIEIVPEKHASGLEMIIFTTRKEINATFMNAIGNHSMNYGLFELNQYGTMRVLCTHNKAYLGDDLPAILKYKGKTNEKFVDLMISLALSVSTQNSEKITLLDPMCSKGTSLFFGSQSRHERCWN